jgi:PAS domain S-box-containing protein
VADQAEGIATVEITERAPARRRSTPSERYLVLGMAALLVAGVFIAGMIHDDPSEAVTVLYTLPIALVAIEFGALAGAAAAAIAVALFGLWVAIDDLGVGPVGFATRSIAFLVLGILLGHFATKLRSAYDAVRRREQQLDAILDNSTAVIYLKDKDGRYMLVNRQFEELFHTSREEVKGKTDHDLFPRYMADAFRANDRKVLKERCELEIEETAPGEHGINRTYISIKFPLFDDDGVPYGVCGISTDISARKKAEQQLRESKDHFREIIDTAHEAFVAMDAAGNITGWNRAAERTFGWAGEKAIGRPLADTIVPERYREAHWKGIEKFLRSGKGPLLNKRIELMAMHRDGHEFPVEMTVSPVRVRGGFMFNAFMHDISERKGFEEEAAVRLSDLSPEERNGQSRDGAADGEEPADQEVRGADRGQT